MNKSFQLIKVFNTDVTHLFQDFKDPRIMQKWSYLDDSTFTNVESVFKEGSSYEVNTKIDKNTEFSWHGVYNMIKNDSSIEFTWDDEDVKNSLVRINFEPVGENKSRILLTHSNLPDTRTALEHKAIWIECLTHLEEHVDNGGNEKVKKFDDQGNYY